MKSVTTARVTQAIVVCVALMAVSSCGLFHRGRTQPNPSQSLSASQPPSGNSSSPTIAPVALETVIARSRDAGGANIRVDVALSDLSTASVSGLLDLGSGEGSADYTSASGRTAQRIITGGKTYTSAGDTWIATPQTGRGLIGGDLAALWRTLSAMPVTARGHSYLGQISGNAALALSGIDPNMTGDLTSQSVSAAASLIYDADGVLSQLRITAAFPSNKNLVITMNVSDVGQIVDVTAPTVAVTGGPEGQ